MNYKYIFPKEYLVWLKLSHILSFYGDETLNAFYHCVESGSGKGLPRTHNLRAWCIEYRKEGVKLPPKSSLRILYDLVDNYYVKCKLCGETFPVSLYSKHYINKHYSFVMSAVKSD